MPLSITKSTRSRVPQVDFEKILSLVLGKKYELSLVFASSSITKKLNRQYRGKDHATNVLSFPLSKTSGEIFIDLTIARKEYKKFDMNFQKFVTYLYIHGLLHLKGMEHGAKMESEEEKLLRKLKLPNGSSNNSRG